MPGAGGVLCPTAGGGVRPHKYNEEQESGPSVGGGGVVQRKTTGIALYELELCGKVQILGHQNGSPLLRERLSWSSAHKMGIRHGAWGTSSATEPGRRTSGILPCAV